MYYLNEKKLSCEIRNKDAEEDKEHEEDIFDAIKNAHLY